MAIARYAGRMYSEMQYVGKPVATEDPQTTVGAEMGGQIDRTLSSELAMLASGDDDIEAATLLKVVTNRQAIRDMEGESVKSRGPLVIALDESGSMHDAVYGGKLTAGRNTFAKACAVALTRIAWAEERAVRVVHFSASIVTQDVPKDDQTAMFEMTRSFLSGGTHIGAALRESNHQVGVFESEGIEGADVVLITDGVDHDYTVHDRAIDEMDANGVRLWTVSIGEDIPDTSALRARAELYITAVDNDLANENTASALAVGLSGAALSNGDLN